MNTTLTVEWKNKANEQVIASCGNCVVSCSCRKQAVEAERYFKQLGLMASLAANNKVEVRV